MPEPKRIGDRLVAAGLVSRPDAESAAVETVLQSLRLVSVLTRLDKLSEADGLRALSEQLGVPAVDLSRAVIDAATLGRIPANVARQHLVVPLVVDGSNLLLAMASPDREDVIDEIRFATGLQVLPFLALHFRVIEAVNKYPPPGEFFRGVNVEPGAAPGSVPLPIISNDPPAPPPQPELAEETELSFEFGVEDEPLELDDGFQMTRPPPPEPQPFDGAQARLPPPAAGQVAPTIPPPAAGQVAPTIPPPAADQLAPTIPPPAADQLAPTIPPPAADRAAPAIPPPAADQAAPTMPPSSEPPPAERTLLVVDDEQDIQTLVVAALEPLGHRIITASRGVEALHLVKSAKPDLIVLDAMLPEVHGFEICRKVKESKRFAKTPVLMISAIYRGWRIAEDIKSLYKVDAFLEKPFRIDELRRAVERLLANAPERDEEDPATAQAKSAYNDALAAAKQNDLVAAFRHLRQAEALEPFSANVQFMLGRVLEQQDRVYQAIYHYERAIELNPTLFPATKNLALLYQGKGFKNKAVEMWERSLRAAPSPEVREQIKQHLVSIL